MWATGGTERKDKIKSVFRNVVDNMEMDHNEERLKTGKPLGKVLK